LLGRGSRTSFCQVGWIKGRSFGRPSFQCGLLRWGGVCESTCSDESCITFLKVRGPPFLGLMGRPMSSGLGGEGGSDQFVPVDKP
jgi:hypothetical protein